MNRARLIHDANEIAKYFAAYPREEAIAGIADHIRKFWDRRMRMELQALLSDDSALLHPLVKAAAVQLHEPPPVS
ncbi:MAG: formate dehydrogenase subunit delta [Reyranellaceae bacterium]